MFFDLKQIESIADTMIKLASKEKLLEGLQIINKILQKIQIRIEEENAKNGDDKNQ